MKSGFSLLELIIATLIASLVSTLLMTSLYQSGKYQVIVDTIVDMSMRVNIVSVLLEKDLIGAFIPVQAKMRDQKKEEMQSAEKEPLVAKKSLKESSQESDEGGEIAKKNKPAPKPIEKIFYSTNKDKHLDVFTFITNNPRAAYVSSDTGVVKPHVVRVQYAVKPEEGYEKKDSFTLFRQEGTELDMGNFKNVREYEVLSGIKDITVMFTARLEKKENNTPAGEPSGKKEEEKKTPQKKQAPQKKEYEYKTMAEWVSEQKEQKDSKAAEFPRIPYFVEIKLSLWNKEHTQYQDFVLSYEIPTNTAPVKIVKEKKQKKAKAVKKQSDEKNQQGQQQEANRQVAHVVVKEEREQNLVDRLNGILSTAARALNQG